MPAPAKEALTRHRRTTRLQRATGALCVAICCAACTGIPDGIQPVNDFRLERYLGRWYEIARLDHSFERGLTRVTAEYARRSDGGISVTNRGYDAARGEWREARGKAYFLGDRGTGSLKVSFFGPFYGGYHVVALDGDGYQWALVSGPSRSYLWVLARAPALADKTLEGLLARAAQLGFPTEDLIFVEHPDPQAP
ncbi:MAG: lipocalin [Pseudomonadales bacterium]|nr:lipocalin [Pseudomonadales bacterium]NIX07478.1 lipocalin [Pseudomonadales bacterium]